MRMRFQRSLSSLMKQSRRWQKLLEKSFRPAATRKRPRGRLKAVSHFGSDPGHLLMFEYVPPDLQPDAALVVVLHGCLQTADDYDRGSGWTRLAREHRFAVLYAEQQAGNNQNNCFNWFRPSAVARDRGELMSIRQMIDDMLKRHAIAPERVFVQGLSAGGAMAAALLATYPERFAGGQIVGGLPFGIARDAMTALSVMRKGAERMPAEWGDLVRKVSPVMERRPLISIWHGANDSVVHPANARSLLSQWLDVYGLKDTNGEAVTLEGRLALLWRDAHGWPLVELCLLDGVDHGLPVERLPSGFSGEGARFMLECGADASRHLVRRMDEMMAKR